MLPQLCPHSDFVQTCLTLISLELLNPQNTEKSPYRFTATSSKAEPPGAYITLAKENMGAIGGSDSQ